MCIANILCVYLCVFQNHGHNNEKHDGKRDKSNVVRINAARNMVETLFINTTNNLPLNSYNMKDRQVFENLGQDKKYFVGLMQFMVTLSQSLIINRNKQQHDEMRMIVEEFINNVMKYGDMIKSLPEDLQDWCFTFLGYYLLIPKHGIVPSTRDKVASFTLSVLDAPSKFMVEYPERAISMIGPWLLAKFHTMRKYKDFEKILTEDPEYTHIAEFLRTKIVHHAYEAGRHADGAFYDYVRSFRTDQLRELTDNLYAYTYKLPHNVQYKPINAWMKLSDILSHSTITVGMPGINLMVYKDRRETYNHPNASLGLKIIQSAKYLRMNLPDKRYAVCGMMKKMPFFDSLLTANNPNLIRYRVQRRNWDNVSSPVQVNSQEPGFVICNINPITVPDNERIVKYPKTAKAGVIVYKNIGLLYQEYFIPELGNYHVRELIYMNVDSRTVELLIEIKNTGNEDCRYVANYGEFIRIPANGIITIETVNNGATVTIHDSTRAPNLKLNDDVMIMDNIRLLCHVGRHSEAMVLYDNNKPVACDFLEEHGLHNPAEIELPTGTTTFVYNPDIGNWRPQ